MTEWLCGCGGTNGSNLDACATCKRPKCEGLVMPHTNAVNHPPHYGGGDNLYEAIKVIDAWDLGFSLGNAVKYICRADKKSLPGTLNPGLEDLKKARWYLDHEIKRREQKS